MHSARKTLKNQRKNNILRIRKTNHMVSTTRMAVFLGGPGLYIVSFKMYSTYFPDLLVWWLENNMSPKWTQMMFHGHLPHWHGQQATTRMSKEIRKWLVGGISPQYTPFLKVGCNPLTNFLEHPSILKLLLPWPQPFPSCVLPPNSVPSSPMQALDVANCWLFKENP